MTGALPQILPHLRSRASLVALVALAIILVGLGMRVSWMTKSALWCDEAESSINALTILQHGVPTSTYLGMPIYENTLTEPWPGNPEYEFRDSSYSPKGVAVYHGWLPLYSIAAAEAIFGIRPDLPVDPPRVRHGVDALPFRTIVPRIPSVLFALGCMIMIYFVGRGMGGPVTGMAALTLMAFNAKTVDFGYQARYYSLTLLATAFAAWTLLNALKYGRWRDFLLLGLGEGLLFHTHLLSAMIFAGVCLLSIPLFLRRPGAWVRVLATGGVGAVIIIPWVLLSDFLHSASNVPKAYRLFASVGDWFTYVIERADVLGLMAGLLAVLLIALLKPAWIPRAIRERVTEHRVHYGLLLAWIVSSYLAFHIVVPAASFFYERLTLILWTPVVLLLSLFLGDLLTAWRLPRKELLAVAIVILFLGTRDRLVFFCQPSVTGQIADLTPLIKALDDTHFPPGTRFYATPNDHLIDTYYTGLPVQSLAPIRASFLRNYPGNIVFLETQMDYSAPSPRETADAAARAGVTLSKAESRRYADAVWISLVNDGLARRGIPPENVALPAAIAPTKRHARVQSQIMRGVSLEICRTYLILRDIPTDSVNDLWMGFYLRFAQPEHRIGKELNILPRLLNAKREYFPTARVVLFDSPPLNRTPATD
jgi:hypothetical protein